jgi:hypothetical protein
MSGRPDAAKYEALIETLSDIERRASASEIDALTASYESIAAILPFLNADPRVVELESTRPLFRLMLAISDLKRGAKPPLLFDPAFDPERGSHIGAPTLTSVVLLREHVVFAFLLLCKAGMSNNEAGAWLAAELRKSGIKHPNKKAIGARVISRWRGELQGKSPKGSDEIFDLIVQGALREFQEAEQKGQLSAVTHEKEQAQALARRLIKRLRIAGF